MTPAQEKQAGEDLAAAAAYIREHGWTKGTLLANDAKGGAVCSLGAIYAVVMGNPQEVATEFSYKRTKAQRALRAIEMLAARIKQCYPRSEAAQYHGSDDSTVWTFNDSRPSPKLILKVLEGGCE